MYHSLYAEFPWLFLTIFHQNAIIFLLKQNCVRSRFSSHPFCNWNLALQKDRMKSSLYKHVRLSYPVSSEIRSRGCISILFGHVSSLSCRRLRYQSISFVFLFVSRYIYADPLHCNMTYLFIRLLKDDLKEYTYAARLSGLSYAIASGMNAILVSKMQAQEKAPHC